MRKQKGKWKSCSLYLPPLSFGPAQPAPLSFPVRPACLLPFSLGRPSSHVGHVPTPLSVLCLSVIPTPPPESLMNWAHLSVVSYLPPVPELDTTAVRVCSTHVFVSCHAPHATLPHKRYAPCPPPL